MNTFSQELTKKDCFRKIIFISLFNIFKNILLNPMQKVFARKKTINRIPVSTHSFLVPWLYISISFYKTMLLKKPLCSPQTKINYLENFLKFFSHSLYFGRYFTFFETSIFRNEGYYILRHNAGISTNYVESWKSSLDSLFS